MWDTQTKLMESLTQENQNLFQSDMLVQLPIFPNTDEKPEK